MEDDSKISLITKRIDEAAFDSVSVTSDFTDLSEYETAKKTISPLRKKVRCQPGASWVYKDKS